MIQGLEFVKERDLILLRNELFNKIWIKKNFLDKDLLCQVLAAHKITYSPKFTPQMYSFFSKVQNYTKAMHSINKFREMPFNDNEEIVKKALACIWQTLKKSKAVPPTKSNEWTKIGFKSDSPLLDVGCSGFLAIENLEYFCLKYPEAVLKLYNESLDSSHYYMFACGSICITVMICTLIEKEHSFTFLNKFLACDQNYDKIHEKFCEMYCEIFQDYHYFWMSQLKDETEDLFYITMELYFTNKFRKLV